MNTPDVVGDVKIVTIAAALLLLVAIVAFFLRRSIFASRDLTVGMTVEELKAAERKKLLSEEEMKRVRQAMARQYVRRQEEEKARRALLQGKTGIEALAIEAERLEAALPAPAERPKPQPGAAPPPNRQPPDSPPPNPEALPLAKLDRPNAATPPESFERYSVPAEPPPGPELPEKLRPMAAWPREQLEDLVNAGFLDRADFDAVLRARGEDA
ncbi:MAG: hypothetical protein PWP23_2861 [Candidatus Sumerlaeota bacterium]|nr:hypothetical protein [Candidatus Sumerlaeota bacterium]